MSDKNSQRLELAKWQANPTRPRRTIRGITCPKCGAPCLTVVDSRVKTAGIRRRRVCANGHRVTTEETVVYRESKRMTDEEIEFLKKAKKRHRVFWMPDDTTSREIRNIGPPPAVEPPDVPEPSDCAYFYGLGTSAAEYVALYNCDPREFFIAEAVFPA